MAVVNLGSPDRASKRAAVIIFSIERLRCVVTAAHEVAEPVLRVQRLVSEEVLDGPVEPVAAGFGGEALYSSGGAPKLSGDG